MIYLTLFLIEGIPHPDINSYIYHSNLKMKLMKRQLLNNIAFPLFAFFLTVGCLQAQKNLVNSQQAIFEQVAPNAYTSTAATGSFLGPYATSARTYQMLIAGSELTNLTGKYLTALAFRALPSASAAWPAVDVTISNYDIYLSGSVNPADRSLTFANNVVGTQTQVRSGSLVIPAGSVTVGGSPNAFSFYINFTTPWLYSGGNLLVQLHHTAFAGTSITSLSTESVLSSGGPGNGYGVTVSSCWASSYTGATAATNGNFSVISLRATDVLGTQTYESSIMNVYPNPTLDVLHIDGNVLLSKVRIFNMLGQLVVEKTTNSQNNTVDLSHLNRGTYLLEMETESGIKKQKIIKN